MFKEFLIKNMLQSQLKGIPEAERQKIIAIVQKNPELFLKIAGEIKEKMKDGRDQMAVAMEVMKEHESELKDIMN